MTDEKRKLCVWVPDNLYQDVMKAGYEGPTSAVTEGLKMLASAYKWDLDEKEDTTDYSYSKDQIDRYIGSTSKYLKDIFSRNTPNYYILLVEKNEELNNEVERLNESLQKAPDPIELAELRTTVTGLKKLLEEKDKRIEDLTKAVDMLSVFANYFKTLNQNK